MAEFHFLRKSSKFQIVGAVEKFRLPLKRFINFFLWNFNFWPTVQRCGVTTCLLCMTTWSRLRFSTVPPKPFRNNNRFNLFALSIRRRPARRAFFLLRWCRSHAETAAGRVVRRKTGEKYMCKSNLLHVFGPLSGDRRSSFGRSVGLKVRVEGVDGGCVIFHGFVLINMLSRVAKSFFFALLCWLVAPGKNWHIESD